MNATLLVDEPPAKTWPPERGWPLFLAWMGGAVAGAVLVAIISSALSPSFTRAWGAISWSTRIVYAIPGILTFAWQAWLLLRKHPVRFAFWTALPLVSLALPLDPRVYRYASLAYPLVKAVMLNGVRRRVWLWILVGMAGVVMSVAGSWMYGMMYLRLPGWLNSLGGNNLPSWFSQMVMMGVFRGIWLLSEALAAWALAWKMPPVERAN